MAQAMFSPETQETITEPETEQEQDTEQWNHFQILKN
jgi:hypothetical protein